MNIFDSHTHINSKEFANDLPDVVWRARALDVNMMLVLAYDQESADKLMELLEKFPEVYGAIGCHPENAQLYDHDYELAMKQYLSHPKMVAVGEIGLDYYWDKEPTVQQAQREMFCRQLALAKEMSLPVIIHSRDAAEDTMNIMQQAHKDGIPGVIHCYSYSKEMAKEYVKMGYYIGVGGVVTFKNAKKLKETVAEIGLPHIVLETDCPYMAPEPHRGTRNDSRNLIYVVKTIAELTGTTPEEVETVTWENAKKLFQKVK